MPNHKCNLQEVLFIEFQCKADEHGFYVKSDMIVVTIFKKIAHFLQQKTIGLTYF